LLKINFKIKFKKRKKKEEKKNKINYKIRKERKQKRKKGLFENFPSECSLSSTMPIPTGAIAPMMAIEEEKNTQINLI
jgi:hypothetical protein